MQISNFKHNDEQKLQPTRVLQQVVDDHVTKDKLNQMDTRVRMYVLLDYKEYYGYNKNIDDANALIIDIPSVTFLNYLSGFVVNLYLYDNDEHSK